MTETHEAPTGEQASATRPEEPREEGTSAGELAQKGGIVVALLVAVVAVFVAFQAVTSAIETWLTPRWVPIWRAIFAVVVAVVALDVVRRLTRVDWT